MSKIILCPECKGEGTIARSTNEMADEKVTFAGINVIPVMVLVD